LLPIWIEGLPATKANSAFVSRIVEQLSVIRLLRGVPWVYALWWRVAVRVVVVVANSLSAYAVQSRVANSLIRKSHLLRLERKSSLDTISDGLSTTGGSGLRNATYRQALKGGLVEEFVDSRARTDLNSLL
jgi:hypothetical protein